MERDSGSDRVSWYREAPSLANVGVSSSLSDPRCILALLNPFIFNALVLYGEFMNDALNSVSLSSSSISTVLSTIYNAQF